MYGDMGQMGILSTFVCYCFIISRKMGIPFSLTSMFTPDIEEPFGYIKLSNLYNHKHRSSRFDFAGEKWYNRCTSKTTT